MEAQIDACLLHTPVTLVSTLNLYTKFILTFLYTPQSDRPVEGACRQLIVIGWMKFDSVNEARMR